MIIGLFSSTAVPVSAVRQYIGLSDRKTTRLALSDETTVDVASRDVENAWRNTFQAVLPANGAKLVHKVHGEAGVEDLDFTEILGFAIDAYGELQAITVEIGNQYEDMVVLFADGHVEAYEQSWKTLDEYRESVMGSGL